MTIPEAKEVDGKYFVTSLGRAITILNTFSVKKPFLKVSEIAEMTGFDKTTVYRFVYTLEHFGYLVRDESTKRYHLSVRVLSLGLPAQAAITVREASLPVIKELSEKVDETVALAVLDGVEIVTIGIAESVGKLYYRVPIGQRSPSYCTAKGQVLLAYQPVEQWDRLLAMIDFEPRTEKTITDPEKLREVLQKVKQQGYSIQDGEFIIGLGSLAAPLFDHSGTVVGAIDIAGHSMHLLHGGKINFYLGELLSSTQKISEIMGYVQALTE